MHLYSGAWLMLFPWVFALNDVKKIRLGKFWVKSTPQRSAALSLDLSLHETSKCSGFFKSSLLHLWVWRFWGIGFTWSKWDMFFMTYDAFRNISWHSFRRMVFCSLRIQCNNLLIFIRLHFSILPLFSIIALSLLHLMKSSPWGNTSCRRACAD